MTAFGRAAQPRLAPEAMATHRAAWADLAVRALEPSIFNDPAFALPAALHLAGRRRPHLLTAWDPRDPARLIGLCCVAAPLPGLPLAAWLHPQATAAFPLLDAAQAEAALADLLAQTRGRLRPAGLLLHGLLADGATTRLIAARPQWSCAVVAERSRAVVRQGPPPPLAGKAGKEFRRQARRLADLGHVAVTVSATPEALETFLRLEAGGWKGRRATALATTPGLARFTRTMAAALAAEERIRIHSLTLDGRPVAMGLVLRSGPHAFFWKTAYDEAYGRFSPGAHLAAAIGDSQAREPSLVSTDSCAVPGHSMIDRLWPERMTVLDLLVTPSSGLSGPQRLALRLERGRRTAKAWAKRALAGGPGLIRSARHNATMATP